MHILVAAPGQVAQDQRVFGHDRVLHVSCRIGRVEITKIS